MLNFYLLLFECDFCCCCYFLRIFVKRKDQRIWGCCCRWHCVVSRIRADIAAVADAAAAAVVECRIRVRFKNSKHFTFPSSHIILSFFSFLSPFVADFQSKILFKRIRTKRSPSHINTATGERNKCFSLRDLWLGHTTIIDVIKMRFGPFDFLLTLFFFSLAFVLAFLCRLNRMNTCENSFFFFFNFWVPIWRE